MNHRSEFDHRKGSPTSSYTRTDIKRETRRFEHYHETQSYPNRHKDDEKNNAKREVKGSLNDSPPSSDAYGADFYERDASDEIYMSVIFWSLVEIADVAIGDAVDLAVLKEYFFYLIR